MYLKMALLRLTTLFPPLISVVILIFIPLMGCQLDDSIKGTATPQEEIAPPDQPPSEPGLQPGPPWTFTDDQLALGFSLGSFTDTVVENNYLSLSLSNSLDLEVTPTNPYLNFPSLIGHWSLNESTINNGASIGDTLNSSNGVYYSNEGTLNKSLIAQLGGGADFDGIDDSIEIPHNASLAIVDDTITFMGWIWVDSSVNTGTTAHDVPLICKGPALGSEVWLLGIDGGQRFNMRITTVSGFKNFNTIAGDVEYDKWIHLAGVYDGQYMIIYINGRKRSELFHTGNLVPDTSHLYIGRRCPNSGTRFFKGKIDEVAILDDALTEANIFDIYTLQRGAHDGTFVSQVFDSVSSTTTWQSIAINTAAPYGKEISSVAGEDLNYDEFGVSSLGLISLWHFNSSTLDENTNSTLIDTMGFNNGILTTVEGVTDKAQAGKFNSSIYFDGTDDIVTVNDSASLSIAGSSLTLSAWIYPTNIPQSGGSRIISKSNGASADDYMLGTFRDESKAYFRTTAGSLVSITSKLGFALNRWTHLAGTYDGAEMKLYINGVLDSTAPQTGNLQQSNENLTFGSHNDTPGSRRFEGQIDETAIWSRALSANEIQSLAMRGLLNLKAQIRSCNNPTCSATTFIGPDGTNATFYSNLTNSSAPHAPLTILNLTTNQYFQYKLYLEELDPETTLKLNSIQIKADD